MTTQSIRWTTVHDRYHVGSEVEGLIETALTRDDALRMAQRKANRAGHPFTVYDTMARRGAGQLWTVHPGADPDGPALVIPPTRRRSA